MFAAAEQTERLGLNHSLASGHAHQGHPRVARYIRFSCTAIIFEWFSLDPEMFEINHILSLLSLN